MTQGNINTLESKMKRHLDDVLTRSREHESEGYLGLPGIFLVVLSAGSAHYSLSVTQHSQSPCFEHQLFYFFLLLLQ